MRNWGYKQTKSQSIQVKVLLSLIKTISAHISVPLPEQILISTSVLFSCKGSNVSAYMFIKNGILLVYIFTN